MKENGYREEDFWFEGGRLKAANKVDSLVAEARLQYTEKWEVKEKSDNNKN